LSPGRGLRRATLEDVAFSEGDGSWAVAAEVEGALGLATLGTGVERPLGEAEVRARQSRIDREPVTSAAAFADHLRVVWLVPAMDQLFAGPGSERRRFLDRLVLAVDAGHGSRVAALERSLRSRNRLLEERNPDAHWLDAGERGGRDLDRRAEGAADRSGARACGPDCAHDRLGAGAAARRGRRPSRSGAAGRAVRGARTPLRARFSARRGRRGLCRDRTARA